MAANSNYETTYNDYINGTISYEEAVSNLLDIGEADTNSDAQAIVDSWTI